VLETVALVNTGFETPNPQILLPVKAAEKLKLRPNLPPDALVETYDTAGGPTRVYRVRNAVKVEVPGRGISATADAVISHSNGPKGGCKGPRCKPTPIKWDSRLGLPIPPKTSCQHP
jgi:hypothetical protein